MAKIVKIGSWDKKGMPVGWEIDIARTEPGTLPISDILSVTGNIPAVMGLGPADNPTVSVGGVEIVEWTELRKMAMKCNKAAGSAQ